MRSGGVRAAHLADAFEALCRGRHSARSFIHEAIPQETLRRILELTQTAPSSYNLQPYKIVLVQSQGQREALSTAMLGPNNVKRVREAPLTVVFCADKDPSRLAQRIMKLEVDSGMDPAYVSGLSAKVSFVLGKGLLSTTFRTVATHLMSPLRPAPVIAASLDAWASKNVAFAAQTFMLAAQANGLSTAPMEGFDERRVGFLLGIPSDRYTVPLVVSTGYAAPEEQGESAKRAAAGRRLPLDEIACRDRFDVPYLTSSS